MEGLNLVVQLLEEAAPWFHLMTEALAKVWKVSLEVVEGRPRVALAILATGGSSFWVYRHTTRHFDKWHSLGVPYEKGHFPYGSFNLFSQQKHLFSHITELQDKYRTERYVGWFLFRQPVLNINDPELLRIIMVKDFNTFVERSSYDGETFKVGGKWDRLWGRMLTSAQGEEWKQIRAAFSPIFTSGRMKGMLRFIKATGENLALELETRADSGEEISLKELYGKYTMDGIAASAFGMDTNSFQQKDSAFLKYAESVLKITGKEELVLLFKTIVPGFCKLLEILNISLWKVSYNLQIVDMTFSFQPKETKFLYEVIKATVKARKTGKQERRNDLVDLMMDCLKQDVKGDEEGQDQCEEDTNLKVERTALDEDTLVATAMIFMIAGYDTTAITLSFLSYMLASHPEEQEKLQQEVDQAYEDAGGEFPDYSTIQSLPFLDMVIHEALRLHSPLGMNTREASTDYSLPGTDIHLKKGDLVSWSSQALHKDPAHWSHPEQFYPEHFSKKEKSSRSTYAFQGFGQVNQIEGVYLISLPRDQETASGCDLRCWR